MEKFNNVLAKDMERVIFGLKSIHIAFEKDAIETLIVSDDFLRKISASVRKDLTHIMRSLKEMNREVIKMSSMHYTGEKINSFGGICAILKYALDELTDIDEDINSTDIFDESKEDAEGEENMAQMIQEDNIEEEEKDEVDDLQDDEDDFLGHRSSKYHKGKPSRVELKERDLNRKTAARKKSSFDDEI